PLPIPDESAPRALRAVDLVEGEQVDLSLIVGDEHDRGGGPAEDRDVALLVLGQPLGKRSRRVLGGGGRCGGGDGRPRRGTRGSAALGGDGDREDGSGERAPHEPRVFTCAAMSRICSAESLLRYGGIFPFPSATTLAIASSLEAFWNSGALRFREPL